MRIQNNVMAMNTHRNYTINNANIQKSAEKLSSGYRINRAGDDAAGLAISEKMRSQIRGLNMASKNSQDAISLVQTAEGALQEVHSMLQRMNELAVQSATGTNQEFDRSQLNKEFNQLKREINDIAEQTTFNNMKILDGSLSNEGPQRSAQTAGIYASKISEPDKAAVSASFTIDLKGISLATTASATLTEISVGSITFGSFTIGTTGVVQSDVALVSAILATASNGVLTDNNNVQWKVTSDGDTKLTFTAVTAGAVTTAPAAGDTAAVAGASGLNTSLTSNGVTDVVAGKAPVPATTSTVIEFDATKMQVGDKIKFTVNSVDYKAEWRTDSTMQTFMDELTALASAAGEDISVRDNTLTIHGQTAPAQTDIYAGFTPVPVKPTDHGTMRIQVGALENEQLNIEVKSMNSYGLGLDPADLSDQELAGKAITATRAAINQVSDQRSLLGATQNRLEHKISNLDNTAENLQSAESRIRDVDVAKEMTVYTKNNILAQASTSMLAQANAAPQGVLSLLQG